MKNKDSAVLVRYTISVQPDGNVRSDVLAFSPDEFLAAIKKTDPDWVEASIVAQVIGYVNKKLEELDEDLEKYIASLN